MKAVHSTHSKVSRFTITLLILLLLQLTAVCTSGWASSTESTSIKNPNKLEPESNKELLKKTARVEVPFIANEGQLKDNSISYYAQTFGGTLYVKNDGELVYSLVKSEKKEEKSKVGKNTPGNRPDLFKKCTIKESLLGAKVPQLTGSELGKTKINYLIGNDRSKWKSNLASYNNLQYGEVYPGIELCLKATGVNVEKVFTVNPGAEVSNIRINIEGTSSISVNETGQLVMITPIGEVQFTEPVAYQYKNGIKEYVQVKYNLDNSTYGFTVGEYDHSIPLIIDPLLAATYAGGYPYITSLACDKSGNVYITGDIYSTTTNYDIFILKFNSSLSSLLSYTIIGGSNEDLVYSIAIDKVGTVYLSGASFSSDYPSDNNFNGGADVIITKLTSD